MINEFRSTEGQQLEKQQLKKADQLFSPKFTPWLYFVFYDNIFMTIANSFLFVTFFAIHGHLSCPPDFCGSCGTTCIFISYNQ